jgi:hypothetical protein
MLINVFFNKDIEMSWDMLYRHERLINVFFNKDIEMSWDMLYRHEKASNAWLLETNPTLLQPYSM